MASTLCKYDLRKSDSFVLSWAKVRRVMRGSISSELLMCAQYFVIASCGWMPRHNICMYMAHAYFYICCSGGVLPSLGVLMKSIGAEFLQPVTLAGMNHMGGMQYQIVLNITFCPERN